MKQTGSDELHERMVDLDYVVDDGLPQMSAPRAVATILLAFGLLFAIVSLFLWIWTILGWYTLGAFALVLALWQIHAGLKDKWFWELLK